MDTYRGYWNKNNTIELHTLNPAQEREACYLTEAISKALITDEREAFLLDRNGRYSIDGSRNLPELPGEQEEQKKKLAYIQEAAARHCNGSNVVQNTFDEQESSAFYCSAHRFIDNSLKLTKERETTIFYRSESSVVQSALNTEEEVTSDCSVNVIESTLRATDEQEAARFHNIGHNIIATALKSINERKAASRSPSSSASHSKRGFDRTNLAIANKENELNTLVISDHKLLPAYVCSAISNAIADPINDTLDSIDLNPLKRSKALANFQDVDDSTVPYVSQKKQKREDQKTNEAQH